MSGDDAVAELLVLADKLTTLIDAEVERLKLGQTRDIAKSQDEKTRLVNAYASLLAEMRNLPEGSTAPAAKEEALAATRRLEQAAARNVLALDAAREVNTRLMDAVVRAATAEQTRDRGYASRPASDGRRSVSIALDQRL